MKLTEGQKKQFMVPATDPLATERMKMLPKRIYQKEMGKYRKWHKRIREFFTAEDIPRIFSRLTGRLNKTPPRCPHCPYSGQ
jgi:hypothetical protein